MSSQIAEGQATVDKPVKLPTLTGLRWLAAFLVFGFHVGTLNLIQTPRWHHDWDQVFGQGASGVSFFFVLSGFVLVWSARSDDTAFRFWRRRVAKIYPNHVVTWAAVIVLMLYWGDQVRGEVAVGNLFLVHPWLNFDTFPYSINTVSWSLGCEAFFYLCFPLVLPLVKRAPTRVLYAAVAVLWVGMYEVQVAADHMAYPWNAWFSYLFPPARSLEFWIGVAVGELLVRKRWVGPGLWGGTAIAVAIYTATRGVDWFPLAMPTRWWAPNLAVAFAFLIAGGAKADVEGKASPWRWRPLVWLGEVSFAFYLVHVAFMENVLRFLHRNGHGWTMGKATLIIPAFLGAALLLSWLLYRFVEMPMMRLLGPKRRGGAKVPVQAQPVETAPAAVASG